MLTSIAAGILFFKCTAISLSGELASKIFIAFAVIFSLIQGINLKIIKQLTDIQKISNISYWSKWRLTHSIEERRKPVLTRIVVGIVFAIVAGILGGFMTTYKTSSVPYYLLGLSSALTLICLILFILTFYEFSVLSHLESDMIKEAEKEDKKKSALESIRKEEETDNK